MGAGNVVRDLDQRLEGSPAHVKVFVREGGSQRGRHPLPVRAELPRRLLVTILMALVSEAALYRICLALLILTQVLLCATANISATGIVALTFLSALSLAPLYPLIVSFLLARTGNHASLGPLFATASFGGASLPWLTGVFSTQLHNLRIGFLVPAAGAALLLLLSPTLTKSTGAP